MNMYNNKQKRCKYLDGALYTDLFSDCCDFIEPSKGQTININVTTEDSCSTTICIFCDGNIHSTYLTNCKNLGIALSKFKGNTFRRNRRDIGNMYIVGNGKMGNGKSGTYRLTEEVSVKKNV